MQQFLLYNCIPGCAMIFNSALREMTGIIPTQAYMHDWWVALLAASFGKIFLVNEPLIKYRQHEINNIGTIRSQSNKTRMTKVIGLKSCRTAVRNNREMKLFRLIQAEKFMEIYHRSFDGRQKKLISMYIDALKYNRRSSLCRLLRNGFIFMNRLYTIKFFWL